MLEASSRIGTRDQWKRRQSRRRRVDTPKPRPHLARLPAPGEVAEWLKAADCKSARASVRWFESSPLHQPPHALLKQVPDVASSPRFIRNGWNCPKSGEKPRDDISTVLTRAREGRHGVRGGASFEG